MTDTKTNQEFVDIQQAAEKMSVCAFQRGVWLGCFAGLGIAAILAFLVNALTTSRCGQ